MAKKTSPSKTTSDKAASSASKVLRDGRTSKDSKTAAGSALSQHVNKKTRVVLDLEKNNMKLSEYRETYEMFTGKLSDINRQIAFAGIAIIWVFKQTNGIQISICNELVFPLILLALALGADMVHYIYQSFVWAIFYGIKEGKGLSDDADVKAPSWINIATWVLFCLKILFVIVAYVLIIKYLIHYLIP